MSGEHTGRLGILHVPKSGGTAVRNVLSGLPEVYGGPLYFDHAHFGSERLRRGVPSPNADTIASSADIAAVVEGHRAVIGHYSGPTLLDAGCTALAVQVREPRSRILSLYRFWEGQDADERAGWGLWGSELVAAADVPLREFLRADAVWPATDNAMHRQIVGTGASTRARPFRFRRQPGRGTSAAETIAVAEWADRSETFLKSVCSLIGQTDVPTLGRDNVTEVRGETQEIEDDTLGLLARLTEKDSMLLSDLMRVGILEPRSAEELDEEFHHTLQRLSFRMPD
jgi:hypothetical protein